MPMVSFVCDHCGKCCTSLGAYIRIERQLSDQDYYCKNTLTGEVFPVHVGPEFADAIDEEFTSGQREAAGPPKGCIFMRKNPEGPGTVCAIYPTLPQICREFRCYHMIIFDSRGEIAGRMVGRADIQTTDPVLARIWNDEVRLLPCPATPASDPAWVERVRGILVVRGYRGEPVG